jgi:phosphoribosylamine---glycine ligase
MKILVVGSGGREHALVKSFRQSPLVTEIHVIPGNDGMTKEALCYPDMSWKDFESVVHFCAIHEIDFVFIGPEDPLVSGLSNFLRTRGIHCVGPDQEAAQLEGSKIFAKLFMQEAGVPTSQFHIVDSVEKTLNASQFYTPPYVLKADGLCAGKGVAICKTLEDLETAAHDYFEKKTFGVAGEKAVLEQFMPGFEISYTVITDGEKYFALPIAQDHKRLLDDDIGPNTGGMGTVAPVVVQKEWEEQIKKRIVEPTLKHMKERNFLYRGIVFIGVMMTASGPQVIEYNTRLGDPETQVLLPLIDGDTALIFSELSKGKLVSIKSKNISASCVIMAAIGYPDSPQKGISIQGPLDMNDQNQWVIHSGTKKIDGQYVTNSGRVIGCVGIGSTIQSSIAEAYKVAEQIQSAGLQFRKDIGAKLKSPFKTDGT